ncbi:uncharacterized protein LOC119998549 [Tripterygium wilfordii]|uniref:uncharacterized protein LOC119998549 n=1 Tax=Tripterygium wilfordii TaxID=458696 RepID=UPI0018F81B03|nr:uncharacterized protein LOC119998549 [Tripterygium wilfordii]
MEPIKNIEGSTIHIGGDDLTSGGLNNLGSVASPSRGVPVTASIGGMAAPNGGEPKNGPIEPTAPIYADGRTVAPLAGRVMVPAEKPEKFTGKDFKRWQPKMRFYLTTLNLVKNYILNGLVDDLYNVYSKTSSAKELWDSLEKKYKTEDVGTKKFVVAKFFDFMMVDAKSVVNQLEEFQLILHEIHAEGLVINESFQVAAVIKKLPPSWTDFKNYLKHKRKAMNMEDLMVHLRIEEDNWKKLALPRASKAHLVETSKPKHGKRKRGHQTKGKLKEQPNKFQGTCFVYDKPEHQAKDCRKRPNKDKATSKGKKQAHLVKEEENQEVFLLSSLK